MPPWIFWLCLITLCGSGLASDVPFVFGKDTSDLVSFSSDQLQEASSSSPDLVGVPPVISPSDSEVLEIPVTGGGSTSEGKLEKEAGDLKEELNKKVEPDNTRIHEEAVLVSKYPGDLGIDQINEIYLYLKYGEVGTKNGWRYVRDTRGIDSWNYANESLKIGDRAKCVGLGDCDDFAILMAAFVESIGGATRIILANNNSKGGHAYTEVYLGQLNDFNYQVKEIMEWLQQEFDAGKIYGHVDTDTKEVWLNLDWGPDEKGNAHPGGPLFQGDKHYVLRIRENYKLIPMKMPEARNKPPKLISLTPDKNSPQEAGSVVTWTARGIDPENDQIFYQFFLNNDSISKWLKNNTWTWKTTDYDIGENQIGIWVRDGKHAGPNAFDSNKVASFTITEPKPKPKVLENQPPAIVSIVSDKPSPQDTGNIVIWTAEASDPESDSLVYRFLLNGQTVSDWSSASGWTWTTTSDDIGENQIEVQVRDEKHAGSKEFDDQRLVSFMIPSQVEKMPHSEKISGTGSIKKDYYIQNKANDSAKVSVDIKNAAYYEYTYNIYSDEIQCNADLNLVVKQAESLTCSGNAKNRKNIPTNITTTIKNGGLEYNNSVVASNQGVQAFQNISFDMSSNNAIDSIDAIGMAFGDNNIIIENIIAANICEHFQGMQKISVGRDTLTSTQINAITGPLKVSSSIWDGNQKLNTIADVAMGVVSIDQLLNPSEARQGSQSIIGEATFDTVTTNANRETTRVNTKVGSGNLNLFQLASWKDAFYNVEYEYMPTSYQTGTYDKNLNTSKVERDYVQRVRGLTKTTGKSIEPTGNYATITIRSAQFKGFDVKVDDVLIGSDGNGGDALDGIYTFKVTGNQQHTIRAEHPYNWKWWQYPYNAGESYSYDF